MTTRTTWVLGIAAVAGLTPTLAAQSSSLMRVPMPAHSNQASVDAYDAPGTAQARSNPGFAAAPPREESRASTRAIESMSLIAIPRVPPRKFKVHDLVTIIVRQQKKYEADAKLDTEKKWDIDGKLSEWFRFYPRHRLGSDELPNGEPGFAFAFNNKYETDGQNEREDKFITRIQARVIDVKPNGNLILEARQSEKHDDEEIEITLTGECRSEDVTPDNSVLSTQIADLVLVEQNTGAVRDATQRGWIPRILDVIKPF